MDISLLIPDRDQNWIIKHNILYYKKFAMIPLANYINGDLYINLDKRYLMGVIKLIKHCLKLNLEFMFLDHLTITEKFIPNEHFDGIFFNNLLSINEPKIFRLIKNNQLSYTQIICNFIKLYNCHNRFIKVYGELKKDHFQSSWFDWFDHQTHYRVKDKEVREYYDTLFREVKISILLSED
jgi:hypothetical protein